MFSRSRWLLKNQRHKNPVIVQIPEEMIKVGGGTIRSDICNRCMESGYILSKFVFIK